jgi:4-amino-4-deoxy-L-arabinose transferase-like glycosyltransferase
MTAIGELHRHRTTQPPSDSRGGVRGNFAGWLALVMVGGLVLRIAYVLAVRHDGAFGWPGGDGAGYHFGANLLADGQGFVNPPPLGTGTGAFAHHPPLWTIILAIPSVLGLRTWLDQQLFSCLLGTATIAMVGVAGRRIAGGRAGLVAAVIAAGYPGLWVYERQLLSETLVLLLVAALLYLAYRFIERPSAAGAAGVGAVCGLVALTRSEQILLVVALVAPIVLLAKVAWRQRLAWLAIAAVATLLIILPWTLYNLPRFERPVVLSTSLGPALAVANCDSVYSGPRLGFYDSKCIRGNPCLWKKSSPRAVRLPDASVQNMHCIRSSLDYIGAHLGRLPIVELAREGRAWSFFRPFQQTRFDSDWRQSRLWVDRLALFSYWALLPGAAFGAVVLRRRAIALYPLLTFVLTTCVAVAITYGETRYRASAEISLVLLAGIGVDSVLLRLARTSAAPAA